MTTIRIIRINKSPFHFQTIESMKNFKPHPSECQATSCNALEPFLIFRNESQYLFCKSGSAFFYLGLPVCRLSLFSPFKKNSFLAFNRQTGNGPTG
jgi:hypothetical protein